MELDHGPILVEYPTLLSVDDCQFIEEWFAILLRVMKRGAARHGQPSEEPTKLAGQLDRVNNHI